MAVENTLGALGQLVQAFPDEPRLRKGAEDYRARIVAYREKTLAEDAAREAAEAEAGARIQAMYDKRAADAKAARESI
jgi:hypothetical protein